jgi:hypothetical protein
MIAGPFSNPLMGLIHRTEGPLKFRFVLQPTVAILLAIRNGVQDWRAGKPPYFWEVCNDPALRKTLIRDGWRSIGRLFLLAFVLDCIYQAIVLHRIYLLDALAISICLAIIPYLLVRGPVVRILRRRSKRNLPQAPSSDERKAA